MSCRWRRSVGADRTRALYALLVLAAAAAVVAVAVSTTWWALAGLAFLLLQQGQTDDAVAHLRAFLARPPSSANAQRHVAHARATLAELTGEGDGPPVGPAGELELGI